MTHEPRPRDYSRLALAIVIAGVVIVAGLGAASYETVAKTVTQTSIFGSSSLCDQQVWNPNTLFNNTDYPILLMQPGSIAFVCVTYQSAWQGNTTEYQADEKFFDNLKLYQLSLTISKEQCENTTGCSPIDLNDFMVSAPVFVPLTAATNYVTVVFTMTARSNSTGFYDNAVPYDDCEGIPLAVGYTAAQLNASDFEPILSTSCPPPPLNGISTSVGGMNMTYITL